MPIQIDPTITAGNIVNIAVSVGAIMLAFWRVAVRLTKLEFKLNLMWSWWKKKNRITEDKEPDEN